MDSKNLKQKVLCCGFFEKYGLCDNQNQVAHIFQNELEEENEALLNGSDDMELDFETGLLPISFIDHEIDWQILLKLAATWMDVDSFLRASCVCSAWQIILKENSREILRIIGNTSFSNVPLKPLENFHLRLLAAERMRSGESPFLHLSKFRTTNKTSANFIEIFENLAYTAHNENSTILMRCWELNNFTLIKEWHGRTKTSAQVVKIIAMSENNLISLACDGQIDVWTLGFFSTLDNLFKGFHLWTSCIEKYSEDLIFSISHFESEQAFSFPFVMNKSSPRKIVMMHRDPHSFCVVRTEQLPDVPFADNFNYELDLQDSALVLLINPTTTNTCPLVWIVHVDTAQVVWQIEVEKSVQIESIGFCEQFWFSYNFSTCFIGKHDITSQTTTLHHLLYNDKADEVIGDFEGEDRLVPDQELFQKVLHQHFLIVFGPDEVLDENDPLSPMAFNIHVWDVRSMTIIRTIFLGPNYYSSCLSANDGHLFMIDGNLKPQDSNVTVWDIEDDTTSLLKTNFVPLLQEMRQTLTSNPGTYTLCPDKLVFDDGKAAFCFCMVFHTNDRSKVSKFPGGFVILDFCRPSNVHNEESKMFSKGPFF